MKYVLKSFIIVAVLAILIPQQADAARKKSSSEAEGNSGKNVWVGLASSSAITSSLTPALSAMIGLNDTSAVQLYASISSVSPFNFGIGGNYKMVVTGNMNKGLHMGGGIGLGTGIMGGLFSGISIPGNDAFFFRINAIGGLHFNIVKRVLISLDAGLTLIIQNSDVEMELGGHSWFHGMSILYQI